MLGHSRQITLPDSQWASSSSEVHFFKASSSANHFSVFFKEEVLLDSLVTLANTAVFFFIKNKAVLSPLAFLSNPSNSLFKDSLPFLFKWTHKASCVLGQEYEAGAEDEDDWQKALEKDLHSLMLGGLEKGKGAAGKGLEKGKGKGKGKARGKGKAKALADEDLGNGFEKSQENQGFAQQHP